MTGSTCLIDPRDQRCASYLVVIFVVGDDWPVSDEDAVRHAVIDLLEPLGYDVSAKVGLTTDIDLAE